jgi:predicted ferric reductase
MAIILIPMCRIFLNGLRKIPFLNSWLPFEKNKKIHMHIAYMLAFWSVVHTVAHLFNVMYLERTIISNVNQTPKEYVEWAGRSALNILWSSWAGVTGVVMMVVLSVLISSSQANVRRSLFELFMYSHHTAILFFLGAYTHAFSCILKTDQKVCFKKTSWMWITPGICLYSLEILARWIKAKQKTFITKVVQHPMHVIEIKFQKESMKPMAGDYVFIRIPEISKLEWHPFTLTSCPSEKMHSVHIRIVGDWTQKLAKRLGCMSESNQWIASPQKLKSLPILEVDGPFGTSSGNAMDADVLLLVGGGIGVTPFASVLKEISFRVNSPNYDGKLRKVYFIWLAPNTNQFEWFQDLLKNVENVLPSNLCDIRIYLTRPVQEDKRLNLILNDGKPIDPITKLRSGTFFGRPNITEIYSRIAKEFENSENIRCGVHFCGPKEFGHNLRIGARKANSKKIHFEYSKEVF